MSTVETDYFVMNVVIYWVPESYVSLWLKTSGQSVDKDQSSRISLEFKALNIFLNFTKNFS